MSNKTLEISELIETIQKTYQYKIWQ
jgi:hypothetical protein